MIIEICLIAFLFPFVFIMCVFFYKIIDSYMRYSGNSLIKDRIDIRHDKNIKKDNNFGNYGRQ